MHSPELAKSKSEPLSRLIRDVLLSQVLSMVLPPHTRVSENAIAIRFGVSRQPVREAILSLGELGLLHIEGQRSTVVMPISRERAEGAQFARIAIEAATASLSAQIGWPSSAKSMRDCSCNAKLRSPAIKLALYA
jgi:DNA-binding GntR family transcriptional regulator